MMKARGGRALDAEMAASNKGKIRLLSRVDEKKYSKGTKRNVSRYRAERVVIIHEMTIEEAKEH